MLAFLGAVQTQIAWQHSRDMVGAISHATITQRRIKAVKRLAWAQVMRQARYTTSMCMDVLAVHPQRCLLRNAIARPLKWSVAKRILEWWSQTGRVVRRLVWSSKCFSSPGHKDCHLRKQSFGFGETFQWSWMCWCIWLAIRLAERQKSARQGLWQLKAMLSSTSHNMIPKNRKASGWLWCQSFQIANSRCIGDPCQHMPPKW